MRAVSWVVFIVGVAILLTGLTSLVFRDRPNVKFQYGDRVIILEDQFHGFYTGHSGKVENVYTSMQKWNYEVRIDEDTTVSVSEENLGEDTRRCVSPCACRIGDDRVCSEGLK